VSVSARLRGLDGWIGKRTSERYWTLELVPSPVVLVGVREHDEEA
jgi:hypothetical protein